MVMVRCCNGVACGASRAGCFAPLLSMPAARCPLPKPPIARAPTFRPPLPRHPLQWPASCPPRPRCSPTSAWPSSTWVSFPAPFFLSFFLSFSFLLCFHCFLSFDLGEPGSLVPPSGACAASPPRVPTQRAAAAWLPAAWAGGRAPSSGPALCDAPTESGSAVPSLPKPCSLAPPALPRPAPPHSSPPLTPPPPRLGPLLHGSVEPLWPLPGAGGHRQPAGGPRLLRQEGGRQVQALRPDAVRAAGAASGGAACPGRCMPGALRARGVQLAAGASVASGATGAARSAGRAPCLPCHAWLPGLSCVHALLQCTCTLLLPAARRMQWQRTTRSLFPITWLALPLPAGRRMR